MAKCKICKSEYDKRNISHLVCSYECSIEYAKKSSLKKEKATKQKARKALKSFNNSDVNVLKRKAQEICNKYIRLRDKNLPCISCNHDFNQGRQAHAGHYRPQGGNSLWRYDERNIHKQCSICNNHLSGNLVPYRENLISKVGIEIVEELENTNTIKKWTKPELENIIEYYKNKIKVLQN